MLLSGGGTTLENLFDHIAAGKLDAEVAVVVIGSTAGNARHVAKELRAEGLKAGVVKIRCFRPFPYVELAAALKDVSAVAVLDRSESFGAEGGPVFLETRSALCASATAGETFYDDNCLRCHGEPHQNANGALPDGGFVTYLHPDRSEERRVGEECRSRWSPYQ